MNTLWQTAMLRMDQLKATDEACLCSDSERMLFGHAKGLIVSAPQNLVRARHLPLPCSVRPSLGRAEAPEAPRPVVHEQRHLVSPGRLLSFRVSPGPLVLAKVCRNGDGSKNGGVQRKNNVVVAAPDSYSKHF